MTFGVDEKLTPTPLDLVGQTSFCVMERTVFSEVGEQWMGVWSVYHTFFKERELHVERIAKLLNFIFIARLLITKLIGRKSEDQKSFVLEFVV